MDSSQLLRKPVFAYPPLEGRSIDRRATWSPLDEQNLMAPLLT